jgi:hypothetical protein
MALEDFLTAQASITAEAAPGSVPPPTALGGADRSAGNWLTVADGVPCLVETNGATLYAFSGRRNNSRQNVVDATIYFLGDPVPGGMTTKHRIKVTGCPRDADNGTYAVQGVIDPNTLGDHIEVAVERVRKP